MRPVACAGNRSVQLSEGSTDTVSYIVNWLKMVGMRWITVEGHSQVHDVSCLTQRICPNGVTERTCSGVMLLYLGNA